MAAIRVLVLAVACALAACTPARGTTASKQSRPAAAAPSSTRQAARPAAGECGDGLDNDGDGLVDWHFDFGCTSPRDRSEGGLVTGSLEDGWTVLEPSRDTRIVYVSAAGNDAWSGALPAPDPSRRDGPKRSIDAGLSRLRDGFPDWLLLRRGDRWEERIPIATSGRSRSEPLVVSSYGASTEPPTVRGDVGRSNQRKAQLAHVVVAHLRFDARIDGALIGFSGTDDLLVEGCSTRGAEIYGGTEQNHRWRLRRNVLVGDGFYLTRIHDLSIEENVIYRPRGHAMYITRGGNSKVVTRDNLVLKVPPAGRHEGNQNGIMQRPGGLAEGNVVVGSTWYGIVMGSCNDGDGGPCQPPVPAEIRGNLLLDGVGIGGGVGLAGDDVVLPGARVTNNLFVNSHGAALVAEGTNRLYEGNVFYDATAGIARGKNIVFRNNVFFASRAAVLLSADGLPSVTGFVADGNRFHAEGDPNGWFTIPARAGFSGWRAATRETGSGDALRFVDPSRTLATYHASIGGAADREAFFLEALSQRRFSYRPEYSAPAVIAYFRAGFALR